MNKKKIFGSIVVLAITAAVTSWNVALNAEGNNLVSLLSVSIEALANNESSSSDDEADVSATESCVDGTSCECTLCIKGFTDCSPSCPCCLKSY